MTIDARINSMVNALRRKGIVNYHAVLLGPREHQELMSIHRPRIEASLDVYRVEAPGVRIIGILTEEGVTSPAKRPVKPEVTQPKERIRILKERLAQFPPSTEVAFIAKELRKEGYFSPKTAICDINRTILRLRGSHNNPCL